jgi:hypothetical protein
MSKEIWVLLWSKYSADHDLYPYHFETLQEYLNDSADNHAAWRRQNTPGYVPIPMEMKSHDNLWIMLYIGTMDSVQSYLAHLISTQAYAGNRDVIMESI